ncbi:hypothetical protein M0R45_021173 [Rubus argutus]|uniref:Pectinesterase inhibitor domain-containing protein n=1 Tax=Rubus argutus TaxID=59490 RepID=A0AAW1XAN0_RUBAR
MKKPISLVVLIFLIQIVFIPTSRCNDLVNETCKKIPRPNICISILEADPRTEGSDIDGLATIMVGEVERRASDTLSKVNVLLRQKPRDKPLNDCHNNYVAITRDDVPQASGAIDAGDSGKAVQLMNDAVGMADSCEGGFKGHSPLTSANNGVKDVSSVAAAISRMI